MELQQTPLEKLENASIILRRATEHMNKAREAEQATRAVLVAARDAHNTAGREQFEAEQRAGTALDLYAAALREMPS